MARSKNLAVIEPQPPAGIKYMLGAESWLKPENKTPIRLCCEEWGNLGPLGLDGEIKPNKAGFRVKCLELLAPENASGYDLIDGVYYWVLNGKE